MEIIRITSNFITLIGMLLAGYGYCANIWKLFSETEPLGKIVVRGLGILFFPLGCLLGWF